MLAVAQRVAVIAGDGIGPEVIAEAVRVLTAIGGLEFQHLPWSATHYPRLVHGPHPAETDQLDRVIAWAERVTRLQWKHPARQGGSAG